MFSPCEGSLAGSIDSPAQNLEEDVQLSHKDVLKMEERNVAMKLLEIRSTSFDLRGLMIHFVKAAAGRDESEAADLRPLRLAIKSLARRLAVTKMPISKALLEGALSTGQFIDEFFSTEYKQLAAYFLQLANKCRTLQNDARDDLNSALHFEGQVDSEIYLLPMELGRRKELLVLVSKIMASFRSVETLAAFSRDTTARLYRRIEKFATRKTTDSMPGMDNLDDSPTLISPALASFNDTPVSNPSGSPPKSLESPATPTTKRGGTKRTRTDLSRALEDKDEVVFMEDDSEIFN